MLVIAGKASAKPATGEHEEQIEYFLREFEEKLLEKTRFAYAWSFNPDDEAVAKIQQSLKEGDVFLYLPGKHSCSKLRMRVVDIHHGRNPAGIPCPEAWERYCIKELRGKSAHLSEGSKRSHPMHTWFLVDRIEPVVPGVQLINTFRPVFPDKYHRWTQNSFAFLRD